MATSAPTTAAAAAPATSTEGPRVMPAAQMPRVPELVAQKRAAARAGERGPAAIDVKLDKATGVATTGGAARNRNVYDAVNVMVDAMVRAGSSDPAKYLPVLAKTSGYKGVTGVIGFDGKGDIKNGSLTLFTYKAGARQEIGVVR